MVAERTPRAEAIAGERRRRKTDTLDRIHGQKLAVPPEFADDKTHKYYWANDVGTRVYDLTVHDDYDVVRTSKTEASDDDAVKRPVGMDETGKPIYAVLLRKPMEFVLEDQRAKDERLRNQENELKRKAPKQPGGLSDDVAYAGGSNSIKQGGYTP